MQSQTISCIRDEGKIVTKGKTTRIIKKNNEKTLKIQKKTILPLPDKKFLKCLAKDSNLIAKTVTNNKKLTNSSETMEVESDYEDEDLPDVDSDGSFKPKKVRRRQYSKESKGPFVVYIRVIDDHTSLKFMKLSKFIFGTCKSRTDIRQINANKMRVQFSANIDSDESRDEARREANALPMCEWNKKYHIYIPEKMVEIMGCISWSTHENTEELISAGEGKFKNTNLPNVKILDAVRFMKKTDEAAAKTQLLKTNTVRVTFEGLILPEQINLFGLLIPVREFKRRQMFCEKCLNYNHTKNHCNNKPAQQITTPTPSCYQCQGEHKSGDKNCPRRKFLCREEGQ